MERIRDLLSQSEFHLLFFCLCFVIFSWPLVSFTSIDRLRTMFIYLFVCWSLVILGQFLISRALLRRSDTTRKERDS